MKITNIIFLGVASTFFFTSCVSKKVLKGEQLRYVELQAAQTSLQQDLKNCNDLAAENARKKALADAEIDNLKKQVDFLKENNNQALKQLESLSVISGSQAESI